MTISTSNGAPETAPTAPALAGRRVELRPPAPADYEWLYRIATQAEVGYRWRLRGAIPSPDGFVQFLWTNCEAQFLMTRRANGEPLGLCQLIDVNHRHGYGSVAVLLDPEVQQLGWPFEGVLLFVNYVFSHWSLRKLYFESLDFVADGFSSAFDSTLQVEGRLTDHEFANGQFRDLVIASLRREVWAERRAQIERILAPSD